MITVRKVKPIVLDYELKSDDFQLISDLFNYKWILVNKLNYKTNQKDSVVQKSNRRYFK